MAFRCGNAVRNAGFETDLTVDQLAARALMSPRSFARHFRAATGSTPHAWLLGQRLKTRHRPNGRCRAGHVFCTTIDGNRELKSSALRATPTAVLRAISR